MISIKGRGFINHRSGLPQGMVHVVFRSLTCHFHSYRRRSSSKKSPRGCVESVAALQDRVCSADDKHKESQRRTERKIAEYIGGSPGP